MKIGGAAAVLGIGMVASQIGTPHLLTTYECDTDGRKCAYLRVKRKSRIWRK
jgi:hypothetical protein